MLMGLMYANSLMVQTICQKNFLISKINFPKAGIDSRPNLFDFLFF